MTEPRKPRSPYWAAWTLFALLVLYPLSIGPTNSIYRRLTARGFVSDSTQAAYSTVYYPFVWLYDNGPEPIPDIMQYYLELWIFFP
jgi:hypothetical protein